LEYDDVSNDQRKVIYQQRNDILDATEMDAQITALREGSFTDLVRQFVPEETVEEQWDLAALERVLKDEWQIELPLREKVAAATAITDEEILGMVLAAANDAFKVKLEAVGSDNFVSFERVVLLQSIDTHWREHLSALDYLRQGIHLRGYAQKQPKQEYKREAFELFGQLLDSVKNEVTRVLMNVKIESTQQIEEAAQVLEERAENISNVTYTAPDEQGQAQQTQQAQAEFQSSLIAPVGRNDPCPCGSGKKYKFCHGKLA
jgi:preprotein translocase subunit SecA